MGRDKAVLPYAGTTLLLHAIDKLRGAGFVVSVAGERLDGNTGGAECLPDNFPDCGPLGGIEAALRSLGDTAPRPALFLPVDVPLVPSAFLLELWSRAERTGAAATVPMAEGRAQPLCAVYRSSLAAGLAQAIAQGERRVLPTLMALAGAVSLDLFRVEALAAAQGWAGAARWFRNLNTPQDYAALCSAGDTLAAPMPAPGASSGQERRGA